MRNNNILLALLSMCIFISSCSFAGVQHYYKPVSNGWYELDCKDDNALYGKNAVTPIVEVTGNDSFSLYNITAGTDNYESSYTMGLFYIPILPDFFHIFSSHKMFYFMNLKFNVSPNEPSIKIDDIRFFFNGDSIDSKPTETNYNQDFKQFFYRFNIRTTEVNKVLVKFYNVSIKGKEINVPDLILERDWRLFDTMNWIK